MYLLLLGIVLLVSKMGEWNPVNEWSWLAVLWPFPAAVLWWHWADISGYTHRQVMKRLEERKQERLRRALELLRRPIGRH